MKIWKKDNGDPPPLHRAGYWWFVMAVMGGLSLTFNLWMVIQPPENATPGETATNFWLGILSHGSPVLLAALVSHGFKTALLGKWEQRLIIALFLGFMGMSVSHQADLLDAMLDEAWAWFLPIAIDTIALLALRAILTANRLNREAREAADEARDMAALEALIRPGIERDIRETFEATLPAIQVDMARDIWRDIWVSLGGDIPRDIGGDTAANLPALTARLEEDILRAREEEFAARERDMQARFEVERIDLEDRVRQEEQEAAMLRWERQEQDLTARITFEVRKELTADLKGGPRRAISGGKASDSGPKPTLTSEEKRAIIRRAIDSDEKLTRQQLAAMIDSHVKTVDRIKADLLKEMGLSGDSDGESDGGSDGSRAHLKAV